MLVNPVLEWSSEETEIASEGCLSIPFVHVDVERPAEVRVRARDGYGGDLEVQGSGLTARVIQHEMDHLDGVLMIDRISRAERKEAMRGMREARNGRRAQRRRAPPAAAMRSSTECAPPSGGSAAAATLRTPLAAASRFRRRSSRRPSGWPRAIIARRWF